MRIIFKFIFKLLIGVSNFFLMPINRLVATAFPEFTSLVSGFTTFLNTYITPGLNYFFSILPPFTRSIVLFYLSLLLILYTLSLSVHFIVKVIEIIKAVKIW